MAPVAPPVDNSASVSSGGNMDRDAGGSLVPQSTADMAVRVIPDPSYPGKTLTIVQPVQYVYPNSTVDNGTAPGKFITSKKSKSLES